MKTQDQPEHKPVGGSGGSLLQSNLSWDAALQALTGTNEYEARPLRLRERAIMQIFVERPLVRRVPGGDRWRNSGGQRGGVDHWIDDNHGIRKRYGRIIREDGRPLLKFMRFSLLHRHEDGETVTEDREAALYTVEGTVDEPELPAISVDESLPMDQPLLAPAPTSIDLARGRIADVLYGMSRKLPEAAADSRLVDTQRRMMPAWRNVRATINVVANPHALSTGKGVPPEMIAADSSGMLEASEQGLDSIPRCGMETGYRSPDTAGLGSESGEGSIGSSSGSTAITEVSRESHFFDDFLDFALEFDSDWDSSTDSSSFTPPLSASDLCNTRLENKVEGQRWPWEDEPASTCAHSASGWKRKGSSVDSLPKATKATKKGRIPPMAAVAAGLGLCMIVMGRRFGSQPAVAQSKDDSSGVCDGGPVNFPNAVDNVVCPAAPEGSICQYECWAGFREDGLRRCTREPSGHLSYTGGACAALEPCIGDGVSLFDSGELRFIDDTPHLRSAVDDHTSSIKRTCFWHISCTNESLSPTLTFEAFRVDNGNLSIHGDSPYSAGNRQRSMGVANAHVVGTDASAQTLRLGQRRRSKLTSEDVKMLRGIDPWWVSHPISAGQSKARVVYDAGADEGWAGRDLFVASFTCSSFAEECTSADDLELDWVTLQHPGRSKAKLPAWLTIPSSVLDSISDRYQLSDGVAAECTSQTCAHGACIDSGSSQGAYSSQTAFSFACVCQPGWSGDLCDVPAGNAQECKADESDCDVTRSACESVGPGQHDCVCFPGYTRSPEFTCELSVEDPPVGRAWRSGPGYEASDHIVRGTFHARIGESPRFLHASSLSENRFFDPASYSQVLAVAPTKPDGCTTLAYNATMAISNTIVLVSGDSLCDLWVKVIVAQSLGAAGLIMYGDDIPTGSHISWAVKFGRQQIEIPVIITSKAEGLVLRRAALSGPTWVDLHCSQTQYLSDNRVLPGSPRTEPPASPVPPPSSEPPASPVPPPSSEPPASLVHPPPAWCKDNPMWYSVDTDGHDCTYYRRRNGTRGGWYLCYLELGSTRQTPISDSDNGTQFEDPALQYAYEACPRSCGFCPK